MKARFRLATVAVAVAAASSLALAPGIAAAAAPPPLPPGGVWNCLGGVPGQNDCQTPPSQQPPGAQQARHVECSDHLNAPWVAIYKDINFGGQCDAYEGPGNFVLPSGVADTASSINIGANGRFFGNGGANLPFQSGLQIADLRTIGWNDRVQEVQIDGAPAGGPSLPDPPAWLISPNAGGCILSVWSASNTAKGISGNGGDQLLKGGGTAGLLGDLNKMSKGLSDLPVDQVHPENTFYNWQYWMAVMSNSVIQVFTFPSCRAWVPELLDAARGK
jgi:hypothetical protein